MKVRNKIFNKEFGMCKRVFIFGILSCAFLFSACDNFLSDNQNFKELLEEEVRYNTADEISIVVAPREGTGSVLNPPSKVKVGFAFQVEFQLNSDYGTFDEWKIYAGGTAKENLLDEKLYVIENKETTGTSYIADITLNQKIENVRIIPECTQHPYDAAKEVPLVVGVTDPSHGTFVNAPKNCKVCFDTESFEFILNQEYGTFEGWEAYAEYGTENQIDLVENGGAIFTRGLENNGTYSCKVKIIHEYKNVRIFPRVVSHPVISFEHPNIVLNENKTETGTISPRGSAKEIVGKPFDVSLKMSDDYAFVNWEIYYLENGQKKYLASEKRTGADNSETIDFKDENGNLIFTGGNLDEKKYLDEAGCSMTIVSNSKDRTYVITAKTVDRPKIIMFTPSNGSTEVNRAANIKVAFSKSINPESVANLSNIRLYALNSYYIKYQDIDAAYALNNPEFSNENQVMTLGSRIKDDKKLPANAYVYVTLSGGIYSTIDGKNIPLGKDSTYWFQTGNSIDAVFDNVSAKFYKKSGESEEEITACSLTEYSKISPNRLKERKNFTDTDLKNITSEGGTSGASFKFSYNADDTGGVSQIILREKLVMGADGTEYFGSDGLWCGSGSEDPNYSAEFIYEFNPLKTSVNGDLGFDFGIEMDGVHKFTVAARDKYGNEKEQSEEVFLIRDTTPPNVKALVNNFELQNTESDGDPKKKFKSIGGKHYYRNNQPEITLKLKEKMHDYGVMEVTGNGGHPKTCSEDNGLQFKIICTTDSTPPNIDADFWSTTNTDDYMGGDELFSNAEGTEKSFTLPKNSLQREDDLPYYIWLCGIDDFGNNDSALLYNPMLDTTGPDVSDVKVYPLKTSGTNVWAKWSKQPEDKVCGYGHAEIWYGGQKLDYDDVVKEDKQVGWAKGVTAKTAQNIEIRFYDEDGNYSNYSKIVKQRPMTYHDGAHSLEEEYGLQETTITGSKQMDKFTNQRHREYLTYEVEAGPMYFAYKANSSDSEPSVSKTLTEIKNKSNTSIPGTGVFGNKGDDSWLTIETLITGGSYTFTTYTGSYSDMKADKASVNGNTVQVGDFYIQNYEMSKAFAEVLITWGKQHGYNFGYTASGADHDRAIGCYMRDAMILCNIYSEMCGFEPVYYVDIGSSKTVYRTYTSTSNNNCYADNSKNGYRLPTEAEWEYAATSKGTKNVSGGYWYCGFKNLNTSVQTGIYNDLKYDKNATSYVWNTDLQTYIDFGLIGMSGNVWEYCWNPGDTKPLVIKGGDQWNDWWKCYYFYRESYGIDNLNGTLSTGFRMVRNAQW